ncbi:MAG: hypothetical protein ACM3NT_10280 [Methylocystaceae bacterium]
MQFHEETTRMNWYLQKTIKKWEPELNQVLEKLSNNRHWQALPYHTIAINRMLGGSIDDSACLAAVFKLFLLSDHFHSLIQDDSEGQQYNEALQFNILIGDLLDGSAVCLLCEKGWDSLLPVIANMIVQINEGHALANEASNLDVIQLATREWGSYYRVAFRSAAILSNLSPDLEKKLDTIGLDLGLLMTAEAMGWDNAGIFSSRYREGMDWLTSNLSINNNFKRIDTWMADAGVPVPAAG